MKTTFYVNEEKNTTVCVITTRNGVFRGIARCNPDDQWNELKGKTLAESRARLALMEKSAKYLRGALNEAQTKHRKAYNAYANMLDDITETREFIKNLKGPS